MMAEFWVVVFFFSFNQVCEPIMRILNQTLTGLAYQSSPLSFRCLSMGGMAISNSHHHNSTLHQNAVYCRNSRHLKIVLEPRVKGRFI